MNCPRLDTLVLSIAVSFANLASAWGQNEGMAELDEATQLKVAAESLSDVNKVVDLLDMALEKGLDADNRLFAEQLLVSSLIQRAQGIATAILNQPVPNPQQDPRWIQVRQFALTDLQRAVGLDDSQWEAHMLIGQLQSLPLGDVRAARSAFGKVIDAENVPDQELAKAYGLRGASQSDAEKRISDLNRAIELDPENPDYLRLRGRHFYSEDEFENALRDIDLALGMEPEDAATHELRGMVLLGEEKYDEAKESFDNASELVPGAILPYQHRGEVYRRQGEFKKAIEQLTRALDLKPDDAATLLIRATINYQADDAAAAIADLDRVLELNPGLVKAHQLKAEILAAENRMEEAIAHLQHLMEAAPDRPEMAETLYQLSAYYLRNGQMGLAIDGFSKVLEWGPENPDALRMRGDAYLNMGEHSKAISDFEQALKYVDDDQGLLNNLAWVLATSPFEEQRNGERALELATKACVLSDYQTPHILSTLAAAYAEQGDFEAAIKWSQQAVELGKDDEAIEQLAAELASYQKGEPWRELLESETKSDESQPAEPAADDHSFAPPSAPRAPARTADF